MMISKKELYFLLFLTLILCVINACLDIMDIDAAQYAQMSQELLHSKNWLQLFCLQQPYLDKPPLLFWLSALSFKLFGIHNWSFKLPSILFGFLGVYSTYRLTEKLTHQKTAIYSAIILCTSVAFCQMTYDTRTDTLLMGAVIFAAWQLYEFQLTPSWSSILLASLGIALGLLAKGPIGAIIPFGFFFVAGVFYQKKFAVLWNPKLYILPIIVGILLLPMCVGLFQQYNWEGIKFFFWYQSFGRITGENTWRNNPDPFFLLHSTLWAFLPWTILFIYAIFREIKNLVLFKSTIAGASFAFILSLISLSLSKYQLPHYIFVSFPFLAIICSVYAEDFFASTFRFFQYLLLVLLILFSCLVNFYCFPSPSFYVLIVLTLLATTSMFYYKKIAATAIPVLFLLISLSLGFQKELLNYQSYNEVGRWLRDKKDKNTQFVNFNAKFSFAFYFYSRNLNYFLFAMDDLKLAKQQYKKLYVYTNGYGYDLIKKSELANNTKLIFTKENFEISRLKMSFINPQTRSSAIETYYLLLISE